MGDAVANFTVNNQTNNQMNTEMKMIHGFPRRNRIDLYTPAETAIRAAVMAVEKIGAHKLLTDAVVLLGQAQGKVADYVDGSEPPASPLTDEQKSMEPTGKKYESIEEMMKGEGIPQAIQDHVAALRERDRTPLPWSNAALTAGGTITIRQLIPKRAIFCASLDQPGEPLVSGRVGLGITSALQNLEKDLAADGERQVGRGILSALREQNSPPKTK